MAKEILLKRGPKQSQLQVDRENNIIHDVIVCQVGDIKDYREWSINEAFLNDLVKQGNKAKDGLLCNYGHNYDNLGKRLGRISNYRISGNKVIADLKIFEAADKSPGNEKLGTYVMDLAIEDNKAIMFSIKFSRDYFYQEHGGKELKVWYYDEQYNWITPNPAFGKVYPKLAEFNCVDVVDEGAATNEFFAASDVYVAFNNIINSEEFPAILSENHEAFTVLNNFYDKRTKKSFLDQTRDFLGMTDKSTDLQKTIIDLEAKLTLHIAELATAKSALATAQASLSTETERATTLANQITEKDARIVELEAMDAGAHPGGGTDESGKSEEKLYHQTPLSKRRRELIAQSK